MAGSDASSKNLAEPLLLRLKSVLQEIHQEDSPHVPSPPGCKKRASVALVIRIRPAFPEKPSFDQKQCSSSARPFQENLDNFFSKSWVRRGDPEVLFIKRAAREGDRWTSHIAFPGGKREAGDSDDRATSMRETREETGLELDTDHCLFIGNLPERVITITWGKAPLMVLCPFIYLMMRHDLPPLALQPSEIHSAHWVPMRGLLLPSLRSNVYCDVSERFTRQKQPFMRTLIRSIVGQMVFGAVKLKPAESLYCSSLPGYLPDVGSPTSVSGTVAHVISTTFSRGNDHADADDQPLLLWGLTLGIMADLLELIDLNGTSKLWSWPSFSHWDIRFAIWLLTYKFRSQKIHEMTMKSKESGTPSLSEFQVGGLDNTTYLNSTSRKTKASEAGVAAMQLLDGYSEQLRRAVIVALFLRFAVSTTFSAYLVRKYGRSRL